MVRRSAAPGVVAALDHDAPVPRRQTAEIVSANQLGSCPVPRTRSGVARVTRICAVCVGAAVDRCVVACVLPGPPARASVPACPQRSHDGSEGGTEQAQVLRHNALLSRGMPGHNASMARRRAGSLDRCATVFLPWPSSCSPQPVAASSPAAPVQAAEARAARAAAAPVEAAAAAARTRASRRAAAVRHASLASRANAGPSSPPPRAVAAPCSAASAGRDL